MVLVNSGNGTYRQAGTYSTESGTSNAVALADLNNDGVLDLLTAGTDGGSGRATVRLGIGGGTFGAAVSYLTESGGTTPGSQAIMAFDVNRDGNLDLLTAGRGDNAGRVTVRLGTGTGSLGAALSYLSESGTSYSIAVTDINGDGNVDLATAGTTSVGAGATTIRLGTGNGLFGSQTSYSAENYGSYGVQLVDVNGDGSLDLMTSGSVGFYNAASIRLGSGSGTFGTSNVLLTRGTSVSGASSRITIGDLNGDGVTDVAQAGGQNPSFSGSLSVLFGNTRDGISPLQPFSLQSKGDALQALGLFSRTAQNLADIRGTLGAVQSRVNTALGGLVTARESFLAAESRIREVDVTQESASLTTTQIRQQAAAAVLAQANLAPQLALRLLS